MILAGCPLEGITPDVWEAMRYFSFAEQGKLPEDGGILSQTDSFLEAMSLHHSVKANLTT